MGTRGHVVIQQDKKYYLWYNHYDSYPEHLGKILVKLLKSIISSTTNDLATDLINKLAQYKLDQMQRTSNDENGNKHEQSFNTFGDPIDKVYTIDDTMKRNLDIIKGEFVYKRHFAIEWTYFINIDKKTLEIIGGYYRPTYDLFNIPKDWLKEFRSENKRLSNEPDSESDDTEIM
jgi:hypothetical protein